MPISTIAVKGQKLYAGEHIFHCAIGKGGFSSNKHEGDGTTPLGTFLLRECLYRPDRQNPPQTTLHTRPIVVDDGWCDDPKSQFYNLPIKIPFIQSHELLWREDHVYDIIIPIGYNDAPIIAGKGSAIFMHIAKPNYEPTQGCVALSLPDMLTLLPLLGQKTTIEIHEF